MDRPEVAPRYCTILVQSAVITLDWSAYQPCGRELTEQRDHTAGWYWECPADGDHAVEMWRRSRLGGVFR